MLIGLSGTPGTGKTAVAHLLRAEGMTIVDVNHFAHEHNLLQGKDPVRDTHLLDIDTLNALIRSEFASSSETILFEGHVTHLLTALAEVIILRCHPTVLTERLKVKGWERPKIKENVEAEILDVILCEAVDIHKETDVFEINTTDLTLPRVVDAVKEIIAAKGTPIPKYKIGQLDWSEEIFKM